ncbi:MAG: GNAT family N-acetyltransferase [Cyanobacteria bacterium P01_C01_bin.120]
MEITTATLEHLAAVSQLLDYYRVFYQQPSNLEAATSFVKERLHRHDSVILVAQEATQTVGFTQLYPSFSTISLRPIWILNDLFVNPAYRRQGIARSLLMAAAKYATETHAVSLTLATQIENTAAQSLYESLGYRRNTAFCFYALSLEEP